MIESNDELSAFCEDILENHYQEMSLWEKEFVESLVECVEWLTLSEPQHAKINELSERYHIEP